MSNLYKKMESYFNPELAARKNRATAAAAEVDRREKQAEYAAEVGALAANPVVIAFLATIREAGTHTYPGNGMDAAGAYWYRRGLEQAGNMLDDLIATTED